MTFLAVIQNLSQRAADREVSLRKTPEAEVRRRFYLLHQVQKYIFIRRVRGGNIG
jgi:hypothetical protein